jgi:D-alanine-D-alanine ligase
MKTIGVFFGSRSTEHDISIITGELIISGLKGLGYPVLPVYITGDGHWMIDETLGDIKTFTNASKDVRKETRFQKYSLD